MRRQQAPALLREARDVSLSSNPHRRAAEQLSAGRARAFEPRIELALGQPKLLMLMMAGT